MDPFIQAGVRASTVALPAGEWPSVLAFLCKRFDKIEAAVWRDRFVRGRVLDATGTPLALDAPYLPGTLVHYFREVPNEAVIPFSEHVLYQDEHLLVVDKPPFLPVMPSGSYVEQTLLARLCKRFAGMDLAPLHRIDRHTAGLVLFSNNPASRNAYHRLFRERLIEKHYHAWAGPLPKLSFPCLHQSRIVTGEPFFRSQEVAGEPNSQTRIEVLEQGVRYWRYGLSPITGRKHQLRVQLAGLGAPICNDPIYPEINALSEQDDYTKPLKLLAYKLRFIDPINAQVREFVSGQSMPEA